MGLWDKITGKKETKKTTTKKSDKKETKKEQVLKGPDKKIKATAKSWTKGKLDKLSKQELYAVAKEHGIKTDGLTKTQIQSLIVKG